jgi:Ser/Thr protein kinase RdoA (MazF antagonist)
MKNLTNAQFAEKYGYNPVTELPELNISEDATFEINEDKTKATCIVDNQRMGAFEIETGEMC